MKGLWGLGIQEVCAFKIPEFGVYSRKALLPEAEPQGLCTGL